MCTCVRVLACKRVGTNVRDLAAGWFLIGRGTKREGRESEMWRIKREKRAVVVTCGVLVRTTFYWKYYDLYCCKHIRESVGND